MTHQFIEALDTAEISEERQAILNPIANFITDELKAHQKINLNFICTHNSRRSHLSQVWAQTISKHFNIHNVYCFSGGTEVTAMFPSSAIALEDAGFIVHKLSQDKNPIYSISSDENALPVIGFSKRYDDAFNPNSDFTAILTCSSADKDCPYIPGAKKRIALTYEDPKAFDNTPQQREMYFKRSKQIATEMKYIFALVKAHV